MNALERLEKMTDDELSMLTTDERTNLYNSAQDCLNGSESQGGYTGCSESYYYNSAEGY